MSTALSATGRITVPYTIGGFVHKFRVYVRNPLAVGGSYNINSRTLDANDIVWTDALNDLVTCTSWVMPNTVSVGDATLEHQAGGVWSPLATATPAFTNHAPGVSIQGWQVTLVMRDLLLHKVKFVMLEGGNGGLFHNSSLAAITAHEAYFGNWVKEFTASKTLTNAPYNWVVGRGDQYLNTSPLVGFTVCPNRRIRRRRGLT